MLIQINHITTETNQDPQHKAFYQVFLIQSPTKVVVDFTTYEITTPALLFLSPYQHITWVGKSSEIITQILFHGDFYCIEYHKQEVACNGLLFNNIYLLPYVGLTPESFQEIEGIILKIEKELNNHSDFSEALIKAYLQVILALSSKVKKSYIEDNTAMVLPVENYEGSEFQKLLEENFSQEKSVNFYAEKLCLNTDTFSKKIKKQLGKTPSVFIQERIVLESKKLLHLTRLSIKEIAVQLNFQDEHYFSRYFKKNVGVSPSEFRTKTGISIVAE
ncbi:AraC family transcriptional regulator [Elizabethkingia anophelis]|uniref:AraC family transcriptional regulator n=1 Tax=Elizabethkingia anophelis TaxID=1117645 RepID=UPI0038927A75